MKNFLLAVLGCFFLASCTSIYYPANTNYPGSGNSSGYEDPNRSSAYIEREFQELNKNYKQDTAGILTDLLNVNPNSPNASIVVENASPCNIVLNVTGAGFSKKIPIGVGQTRGILVKKDTYRITSTICQANYDEVKYINSPFSVKLSNK